MEKTPERFILSLDRAREQIQTADHLTYITFPLIKENKLLLKILEGIYSGIANIINAILQYEYMYKRIQIYASARDNFETFKRITGRYNISSEQLSKIIEIFSLVEHHKKSPFEFVKNGKIVIMSENMKAEILTLEKIKMFLLEAKDVLRKASIIIKS